MNFPQPTFYSESCIDINGHRLSVRFNTTKTISFLCRHKATQVEINNRHNTAPVLTDTGALLAVSNGTVLAYIWDDNAFLN
jgi:hypothetical protein